MSAPPDDVGAWLRAELARRAPGFTGEIGDETPLADDGLGLDSVALLDLVGAIEEWFGLHIAEEEITPDAFGTLERLRLFIEARRR